MSKVRHLSVITFLTFTFIVGILIFARGFLLNRNIISDKSAVCNRGCEDVCRTSSDDEQCLRNISSFLDWCPCDSSVRHSKFVFLLIDALKFDFVKRMEFLSQIVDSNAAGEASACLFKFMADAPTTTMQRLKAITTGTIPTFIDASANFNSYQVEEDSFIFQLQSIKKRIAFFGDDTWLHLFPSKYFTSKFLNALPSFNAWDLDTVDNAVNESIRPAFDSDARKEWDVLVAHILGVDHCGHRYGPSHPEMHRKLTEADELIRFLVDSLDENTQLVIFGDHGMTDTGDHGGDSHDETESAVIFVSKNSNGRLDCKRSAITAEVAQIDLVPTVSVLMGTTIPFSNIGQVITDILPASIQNKAIASNVAQIHRYISRYFGDGSTATSRENDNAFSDSKQLRLFQLYDEVSRSFDDFWLFPRNKTKEEKFRQAAQKYFEDVKSVAKTTWTQFDLPLIYTGIITSSLSIICMISYLLSIRLLEEEKISFSIKSWLWPSLGHLSVFFICALSPSSSTSLMTILISTIAGLSVFLCVTTCKISSAFNCLMKTGNSRNSNKIKYRNKIMLCVVLLKKFVKIGFQQECSEVIAIFLYFVTCIGVFSNSFVINEGVILGTVLLAVVAVHLLSSRRSLTTLGIPLSVDMDDLVKLPVVKKYFKCSWLSFALLAMLIRISHNFFRCREELQDCNEEFLLHKQLASLPADWVVHKFVRYGIELLSLAVFVVVLRHWLMYRQISASSRPSALVARYIPTVLVVLNCTFRALHGLPFANSDSSHFRPILEHLPRVFNLVSVGALVIVWLHPLCCIGRYRFYNNQRANGCSDHDSNSSSNNKMVSTSIHSKPRKENAQAENGSHSDDLIQQHYKRSSSWLPIVAHDNLSEDVFTSSILVIGTLLTLLLVQVTSEGMSPSITFIVYASVCLVGIYRNTPSHYSGSWSAVIAWCLASQFFFYGTGHQPVFSAIPWDSAFTTSNSSDLGSSPESITTWISPALSVLGNLYVSPIMFSFLLPLLAYWKADKDKPESMMSNSERTNMFVICGKFISLHGLKVLSCLACAAWQRRHLMVWKIFAPKLIFEVISFIVMSVSVTFAMILIIRIDYNFQRVIMKEKRLSGFNPLL